ncbi:MAG: electron transfer flavoprotein beta subunit/FixA family protein, partial [Marinoscillum sp.]
NVLEPTDDVSPITVEQFELPPAKGAVKLIDPDNLGELVNLLKNEAKVL